ncbi:MAG: outer membrane protein assembly factor BamB family protein, partial [Candidatus Heimdallarchaeota archaeon]
MFSKIKPYLIVILVLATPISTFVLSFQFNNLAPLSTVLTDESSPASNNSISKTDNGLLWSATSGLSGDLTTPPILDVVNETGNEEIIYLGTDVGLAKITVEFGDIVWFHSTPGALLSITPVDDISSDGYKDVLITIDNQQFNNTEMLDGRTGEVLWTFRPTENVWLEGIGFSEQETRSWSGLELEDLTFDGYHEVLISSYNTIYALDGTDGSFLWEYEASNDIWSTELLDNDINTDGTKDIIFGSQDGELIVVNGQDGSEIWSIQATKQDFFEDLNGIEHTINRNVYEIQMINDLNLDGKNDVIVTTESGYCSAYDVTNGQLIAQVLVFSRTGGFGDQAIFGDMDFYNVLYFDTISNYASPIGLTVGRTESALGNNSLSAISLINNNLLVEWTTTSIDFDEVREIATTVVEDVHGNYTKMIVPSGAESVKDIKTIQVYALHNRSLLYEWEVSVFSESID